MFILHVINQYSVQSGFESYGAFLIESAQSTDHPRSDWISAQPLRNRNHNFIGDWHRKARLAKNPVWPSLVG